MSDELVEVAKDSARGSFFLISGTAVSTVVMAVGSILVGVLLGPQVYGQYTLAVSVSQLFLLFTDLGINSGVTKFLAEFRYKGEANRLPEIVKRALLLKTAIGLVIFIANYLLADWTAAILLQRPDLGFSVRLASMSILFQVVFSVVTSAFVGLDKTEYNAISTNIQALSKTIISIGLVLVGLSLSGALLGYVGGYVVGAAAAILMLFVILRFDRKSNDPHSFTDDVKTFLHYGTPLYAALLLTGFIPLYQNFVLANFTTDTDLGNYKAATNFVSLISILAIPITTALLPAFSKLDSSGTQKIKEFFKLANKYATILVIPITVIIILFSRQIVQIVYGSTYNLTPLFLGTLCVVYFLTGLGSLSLASFYNGIGETKTTLKMSLITFSILAVVSPLLTKIYSVQGMIITFLLANVAMVIYASRKAKKNFNMEFDSRSILKIYFVAAVSSIPSLLVLRFSRLSNLTTLAVGSIIYLFIYTTLIPLTRTVRKAELEIAARVTKKVPLLGVIARPILKYEGMLCRSRETADK